ncbi:MAG: bifunctional ADP-dependent NAD(P)H-hydrate dehydratase/NAD(P)H-hydrate epimerase, partial [Nostoc sp.]
MQNRQEKISQVVVTGGQMRDIEERIFAAGMPVVALMEKVAGLTARRIQDIYPNLGQRGNNSKLSPSLNPRIGILV